VADETVGSRFLIHGEVALITGGAGLLGPRHAKALLEAGAKVALADIREDSLREIVAGFESRFPNQVIGLECDVTRENEIREMGSKVEAKFGSLPSILVNNAAIDPKFETNSARSPSRLENFPLDSWNREISVGLTGAMLCSRVFGFEMARLGKGVILNIASDLGIIAPDQRIYQVPGKEEQQQPVKPVTYSVIKHGLIGLTRYLATYWGDKGVRANALAPGGIFHGHEDGFVDRLTNLIPMGRMANLDEYEAAIVFLCSNASSYMNGAVLSMDGGRTAW
jgi:NAD(P)-dependent dehydrogenase (short-subunit alcohol dehydrogenase family)